MSIPLIIPLLIFIIYILFRLVKLYKKNKGYYISKIKSNDSYLLGILSTFVGYLFICIIFTLIVMSDPFEDLSSSPLAIGELGKYLGLLFVYIVFAPFFLLISSFISLIFYKILACAKAKKSSVTIFFISLSLIILVGIIL
jgi:hypothetical protein